MKMTQTLAIAFALAAGNLSLAQNYYTPNQNNTAAHRLTDQTVQSQTSPIVRPASAPATVDPRTTGATTPAPTQPVLGRSYLNQGGCDGGGCDAGGCDAGVRGAGGCDAGACGATSSCDCCNTCCDRYLKVFGGWNNLQDLNTGITALNNPEIDFNSGWALGVARGRRINENWRRELELVYRNNTVDTAGGDSGNINVMSFGNLLIRDLNNVSLLGATPYVGGGIGGVYVDADYVLGGNPAAISDNAFAWQGLVGMQKQVNDRMFCFAEYRYLGTTDLELEAFNNDYDVQYQTQDLFFGIRICR